MSFQNLSSGLTCTEWECLNIKLPYFGPMETKKNWKTILQLETFVKKSQILSILSLTWIKSMNSVSILRKASQRITCSDVGTANRSLACESNQPLQNFPIFSTKTSSLCKVLWLKTSWQILSWMTSLKCGKSLNWTQAYLNLKRGCELMTRKRKFKNRVNSLSL